MELRKFCRMLSVPVQDALPIEAKIRECLLPWGTAVQEAQGMLQVAPSAAFVISDLVIHGLKCAAMAARAEHNNRQELT